jgi:hypothetical protein
MADEKHPSGSDATPLPEWQANAQRVQAELLGDELTQDEEVIAAQLAEIGGNQRDWLAKCTDAALWAMRRAIEAEALANHYADRQRRYKDRYAYLRTQIEQQMNALDITRFHTRQASATIQRAQPALVVTDEQQIPHDYWRTTRSLDRAELKDDLKQGVVIDGAHLDNGGVMLVIRRK